MPVQLQLYDMMGHEVSTLKQAGYAAGEQAIQLDLSPFPAGMYLVRLKGEGLNLSRRVVVE